MKISMSVPLVMTWFFEKNYVRMKKVTEEVGEVLVWYETQSAAGGGGGGGSGGGDGAAAEETDTGGDAVGGVDISDMFDDFGDSGGGSAVGTGVGVGGGENYVL